MMNISKKSKMKIPEHHLGHKNPI